MTKWTLTFRHFDKDFDNWQSVEVCCFGGTGADILHTVASFSWDPLGMCVVNDFQDSLTDQEHDVADRIMAGYNATEIGKHLGMTRQMFLDARSRVQGKAIAYLR